MLHLVETAPHVLHVFTQTQLSERTMLIKCQCLLRYSQQ